MLDSILHFTIAITSPVRKITDFFVVSLGVRQDN